MTKQDLALLEQQLCSFADRLSSDDKKLFQSIMCTLSQNMYDIIEVMKMADIHCIPSKVTEPMRPVDAKLGSSLEPYNQLKFTPASKTKGDPLAELAASLEPHERRKLIEKLGESK